MLGHQFFAKPLSLMEMDSRDARLILASRSCLILRHARQDPMPRLREYLQSSVVAIRFALLMDVVQHVWPEPFAIHRLCCPNASLDEALLSRAVHLALYDQRPTFDALLREMLGSEARDLLYAKAHLLYQPAD